MIPNYPIVDPPTLLPKEVACRCGCGSHAVHGDLLAAWNFIRRELGPLRVASGVRCFRHNAKIGGSPNSQHLVGRALDLHSMTGRDLSDPELVPLYLRAGFRGIGRRLGSEGTGVHLDVRTGPRSFFRYVPGGHVADVEAREIAKQLGMD